MNLPPKSNHWYGLKDGQIVPCYEIPCTTRDGMRSPTIADARKMNLLPSVTNVLGVLDKPALNHWKLEQAIMAALTLPEVPGELPDTRCARIIEDMEAQSNTAKEKGKAVHGAIERYLTGAPVFPDQYEIQPFVGPTLEWIKKYVTKVHAVESVIGNPALGYAGRLDLDCDVNPSDLSNYSAFEDITCRTIVDFKTQNMKKPKPFIPIEWGAQLAAYSMCHRNYDSACAWPTMLSVVINTNTPSDPYIHVWDNPDQLWKMFQHAHALWCILNDYNPAQ